MSQVGLPRRRSWRLGGLIFLCSLVAMTAGCGYTHSPLFPTDVRTVAMPIFENRTFYRGMEQDLTEALIKDVEQKTPYKAVNRDHADTIIEGTIQQVTQALVSQRFEGGLPQEIEVRVTIDFTWKNLRTGKVLRDAKGLTAVGRYIPAAPISETFAVAQHQAVDHLASQIVSRMGSEW